MMMVLELMILLLHPFACRGPSVPLKAVPKQTLQPIARLPDAPKQTLTSISIFSNSNVRKARNREAMLMLPSPCFRRTESFSRNFRMPQNLITSIYQTQVCNIPTYLTLTWSKTLSSHTLTIQATDSFSLTLSLHPSTFSFFRNRSGSKSIYVSHRCYRIKLYWDFTRAKFSRNSAEPNSCFYLAITYNACVEFFLGDLEDTALRRCNAIGICSSAEPILSSRREHVFGHRHFVTRARFSGANHEIGIDCAGGVLTVMVDGEVGLVVKRLAWKFRGNEVIMVGNSVIEFYWDVFVKISRKRLTC